MPEHAQQFRGRLGSGKFLEKVGISGIPERLDAGESIEVFNVSASAVEAKKLSIMSSLTGFELKTPDGNFVLVFKHFTPWGEARLTTGMKTGARQASNQFQKAIAEAAG